MFVVMCSNVFALFLPHLKKFMLKASITRPTHMCAFFFLHTGAARKRFGIDGDREAVPLMLELVYNRVRCCLI